MDDDQQLGGGGGWGWGQDGTKFSKDYLVNLKMSQVKHFSEGSSFCREVTVSC